MTNSIGMVGIFTVMAVLHSSVQGGPTPVDFNRDIRPILSNHCFQCHGPDAEQREAELRLDLFAGAKADLGGYAAVVPGKPDQSELLSRVQSTDDEVRMPPADHAERLSKEQTQLLAQWIEQGASYSQHWSFEPVVRPPAPTVSANAPPKWRNNPIDAFVYRRLSEQGIQPSPEAQRETLIRRVALDLLGLPPTLEQVDAFVHDRRPDAYERMVDRTLASPRFGERWGRHWLDQARYADSHGYTNDNARSIWPYRDWVIAAFNRDLPFDQFTIEQLAGDLLDQRTIDQLIATGFHRNTLVNSEGGTKADQFRDEQVKDRVDTTGVVWMGLTVGCAKCHAHKFDPISQEEYYALYAFFNSTTDENSVTPTLKVPSARQTKLLDELHQQKLQLTSVLAEDAQRHERQGAWEAKIRALPPTRDPPPETVAWTILDLSGKSDQQSTFQVLNDKSLLAQGSISAKEEYQATARSPLTKIRSVRLEVMTDDGLPKSGPGRSDDGNFVLTEFWFRTGDGRELRFAKAVAEHSQPEYGIINSIDGKTDTGWAIDGAPEGELNHSRSAWFVLPEPLEVEEGHALVFKMQFHDPKHRGIGRYRLSISGEEWIDRPSPQAIATLLQVPQERRSTEQQSRIDRAFVQADPKLREINQQLSEVVKQLETAERQIPSTMVLHELEQPRQAYVQIRGDFLRRGDDIAPGVPIVFPQLNVSSDTNRLGFARWLMSPDHPLSSRVRVNRIWMRLFGRGLVETENDFGIQGSLPSHPQLLDWLAAEFIHSQWSTKRLLRWILTTATYRQSSHARPDLDAIDPRNQLLARQSRLRVEAEIVRDLALAVSGMLSDKMGGPSVFPPQSDGVYAFTQRKKNWSTSQGQDRYRRGMYTFFYRSAPYPMLTTFDVPKFNTVCTCRNRSNTPLQSLTMANSEVLVELANRLGQRLMEAKSGSDDRQRVQTGFRLCLSRMPNSSELERIEVYLRECRKRFQDESRVWQSVARALMNLDEFVTRE